jgi:hypothetical protein
MGSGFDDWVYWHSFTITINCNSSHIELLLNSLTGELRPLSDECSMKELSEESMTASNVQVKVKVILRLAVSRPVCLGIKHTSGAYEQIFVTVRLLRICSCGALSLTRRRVCRLRCLQMLLALSSAVILGSESLGTRDHILVSQIRDFPFRRLLRLAGSRWRYSIPPPHGDLP